MIVSEDKAKTMWCPHARVLETVNNENNEKSAPVAVNRITLHVGTQAYCIASQCMAWRQVDRGQTESMGYCGAFTKPNGA